MNMHSTLPVTMFVLAVILTLPVLYAQPARPQTKPMADQARAKGLPLCGKCFEPTIFSKSGIGTAHAVVRAKVTYEDAKEHCENWSMAVNPDCDKQAKETLREENGKVYTATADCIHGKLSIADGEDFVYAGLWPGGALKGWPSDFMQGKTRWRWGPGSSEDTGKIVAMEGPTRAPMVDAISRILCPSGIGGVGKR